MDRSGYSIPDLIEIAEQFDIPGSVYMVSPYGGGHINDTYAVETKVRAGSGGVLRRFILQRINTDIFTRPGDVMANIEKVSGALRREAERAGGDPDRECLSLVRTKRGESFLTDEADGGNWRCYRFIEHASVYQSAAGGETGRRRVREAARAFGCFLKGLSSFRPHDFHVIIEDFHDARVRSEQLEAAAAADPGRRLSTCADDLAFARGRVELGNRMAALLSGGSIPERVCHNDTKINNVMFDYCVHPERALAVIDLDTVMPGCSLYDFGDLVRTSVSAIPEDGRDPSAVRFDETLFEALAAGWLESAGGTLTGAEIAHLPFAGQYMTFTIGIRFLADYLNGDVYFKVQRPGQNLDRARIQFALLRELERNESRMREIVARETDRLLL